MYKVDLHTHSIVSPDGGITKQEYEQIIAKNILDYIAITDHNRIDFAQMLNKKFGNRIIVGEEIITSEGEIIGLFLSAKVTPCQSLAKTIQLIHEQDGLVYVPHPFDFFRHGIGGKNLQKHLHTIDIIEGFNGRVVWRSNNKKALQFAQKNHVPVGIGSDAHSSWGIGKTYLVVDKPFTKKLAMHVLKEAHYVTKYQHWYGYLVPSINRINKKFVPKRKTKDEK